MRDRRLEFMHKLNELLKKYSVEINAGYSTDLILTFRSTRVSGKKLDSYNLGTHIDGNTKLGGKIS